MRIDNQRPSDNFQDRGAGRGGGGIGAMALFGIFRLLGFRGMLILLVILGVVYFFNPFGLRDAIFGGMGGSQVTQSDGSGTCSASAENGAACDFSRRILGSTETVWAQQFQQGRLPNYGQSGAYRNPTLVIYSGAVNTDGCGGASSAVGPFYCPGDTNLYIDPGFYETMASRLNAPGDFAQAYVIAHEVGHHVQNLIGAMQNSVPGETQNQQSVRVELQADCFAGVWGYSARDTLAIDQTDLGEAIVAANSIGDDRLGARSDQYTHGTSAQRERWFRRGFESGDARQCDTFAVRDYRQL
jgi:uncharacterized protein